MLARSERDGIHDQKALCSRDQSGTLADGSDLGEGGCTVHGRGRPIRDRAIAGVGHSASALTVVAAVRTQRSCLAVNSRT